MKKSCSWRFFAKDIALDDITMRVMNFQYVQEFTTDEEFPQQVLVPIVERLPRLLSDAFGVDYVWLIPVGITP